MIRKVGSTFIEDDLLPQLSAWFEAPPAETATPWKTATKGVVFVREPYGRLISAYFNKILIRPVYWQQFGHTVMKMAGVIPETADYTDKCSLYATFPEFIRYFIQMEKTGRGRDDHFIPQHEHCRMCQDDYTYIAHLETIGDDLDYILQSVNIDLKVKKKRSCVLQEVDWILNSENKYVRACSDNSNYDVLKKYWLSHQVGGKISDRMEFPISKGDAKRLDVRKFADMVYMAIINSKGTFSSSEQKRKHMINLYKQVPLRDREAVKEILAKDFQMFQYDPKPPTVFPEYYR